MCQKAEGLLSRCCHYPSAILSNSPLFIDRLSLFVCIFSKPPSPSSGLGDPCLPLSLALDIAHNLITASSQDAHHRTVLIRMANRRIIAVRLSLLVDIALPFLVRRHGIPLRNANNTSVVVLVASWLVDASLFAILGNVALSLFDGIPLGHASH